MLRNICIKDFKENVFDLISKETMLITAGTPANCNTMTASWGFMGQMWAKECVAAVVRPQRHTLSYIDTNEYFTLCFMGTDERAKQIHKVCGFTSGRDVNKIEKANLTPLGDDKCTYFDEARLIIICKKLYSAPLDENGFVDKSIIESCYKENDFHNVVIGSIERIFVKEDA